jgi:hypothetical protein
MRKLLVSAGGGSLACQHEHGRPALGRFGETGHRVREPGALVNAAHPDASGHPRVPVRHADRAALVPSVVKARARAAERVRDNEVAAAEHAEHVPNALAGDRLTDDVGN